MRRRHKPQDEIQPDWDMTGAVDDLKLALTIGYRIAEAQKFPEWKPGNEFRATREKQMQGGATSAPAPAPAADSTTRKP